ncbi:MULTISPECIES: hypothetical protein [Azorhizobium]|uniref:hypothetical protein n=1 Tax=Azorhizobium TaxID=6 RepID=UPI00105B6A62|nr:hypothetical protein [Azorhizobium sp. AG788]TDU01145.1 hypothetical protein DFO45_0661 [Azorhizobium sp. AG788]
MSEIKARILTGLRMNFIHPEDLGSALILDLETDEGEERYVLPCNPALSTEEIEAIGDEIMASLDKLIAPSDDEELDGDEDGEDKA